VPVADVTAWEHALDAALAAGRPPVEAFDPIRAEFAWRRVVAPLAALLAEPPATPRVPPRALVDVARHTAARALLARENHGVAGTLRMAASRATRRSNARLGRS
jgi:hypothetical protein